MIATLIVSFFVLLIPLALYLSRASNIDLIINKIAYPDQPQKYEIKGYEKKDSLGNVLETKYVVFTNGNPKAKRCFSDGDFWEFKWVENSFPTLEEANAYIKSCEDNEIEEKFERMVRDIPFTPIN